MDSPLEVIDWSPAYYVHGEDLTVEPWEPSYYAHRDGLEILPWSPSYFAFADNTSGIDQWAKANLCGLLGNDPAKSCLMLPLLLVMGVSAIALGWYMK